MAVSDLSGCAIFGTNVSTTVETVRPPHGLRLKADQSSSGHHQTRLRAARGSKMVVLVVVNNKNLGELKALATPSWLVRAFYFWACSKENTEQIISTGSRTISYLALWKCEKLFLHSYLHENTKFPQRFPRTLWKINIMDATLKLLFHISTAPTTT